MSLISATELTFSRVHIVRGMITIVLFFFIFFKGVGEVSNFVGQLLPLSFIFVHTLLMTSAISSSESRSQTKKVQAKIKQTIVGSHLEHDSSSGCLLLWLCQEITMATAVSSKGSSTDWGWRRRPSCRWWR